jgi:S-adenosylmethionine hydrolase
LKSIFAPNFVELIFQDMLIVDMESTHSSTFHFFTAVDIYAGVAASLAERKKGGQLTEFLKNIRGTIDDDEWDQVTFTP